MKRHLRQKAIMLEATSRCTWCTHFNSDYRQLPAVAPQCFHLYLDTKMERTTYFENLIFKNIKRFFICLKIKTVEIAALIKLPQNDRLINQS